MSTHTGGLSPNSPLPTEITVHSASRVLEIAFNDGRRFRFPFEFLRVFSPSAEVRGHGPGQERLQVGKRDVTIKAVDAVGHYAVQPIFSDGHDTGLYSWDYLYELGIHQDAMWEDYLRRLAEAGASRDGDGTDAAASASAPEAVSCRTNAAPPSNVGGARVPADDKPATAMCGTVDLKRQRGK